LARILVDYVYNLKHTTMKTSRKIQFTPRIKCNAQVIKGKKGFDKGLSSLGIKIQVEATECLQL
jgi:hypothetical protein